ncbi:MAG: methionyl-tRNA formyltransferase [Ignavibacteriaceae bacterium]
MKIVFFGTPQFAVFILKTILGSEHNIAAVVTTPDKEKGRGLKVSESDVKKFAVEKGIRVLQPVLLKDPSFLEELKEINADLFVVVAYRILPREVFEMPEFGSFNLHASLLPKYRGAAPIQWAIIKGETETGVSTFKLEQKVDTGNIYLQKRITIEPDDNFGSLHDKLALTGQDAVMETIEIIEKGDYSLIRQDDSTASPAPKITKEIMKIDWSKSSAEVHNLVRGLSPFPAAFFEFGGKIIKVFGTENIPDYDSAPLTIHQTKTELIIGCKKGGVRITELQIEGRKRMHTEEFLRGFKFI